MRVLRRLFWGGSTRVSVERERVEEWWAGDVRQRVVA
jgi:hypothetical protein